MFIRFPTLQLPPFRYALLPSAIFCLPLQAQLLEPGRVLSGGAQAFDNAGGVVTPDSLDNSTGFFLNSGDFSVSNSTFNGFQTQGGEGSGGGAGLGGVFFINNGASLTLDNVNFIGNAAVGGTGGGGAAVNFSPVNISSSTTQVSVIPTTEGTASVIIEDMMGINSNQITLAQANPFFAEGMLVSGSGIAEGSVIQEISEDGTVITLMAPMGDAVQGFLVDGLTNMAGETSFTIVSADDAAAIAAIGDLEVGTSLSGSGISVGTEITEIMRSDPDPMTGEVTTTIEISIPTTEDVDQVVGNGLGILTSSSVTTAMSNTLTLSMPFEGLTPGQAISGDGFAEGTTITSVSEDGLTIGLSAALDDPDQVDGFTAANQVGVAGENVLTLSSPNAQIQEGFLISGQGIPPDTRVISITENEFNETVVQLSNSLTEDLVDGFTVSAVLSSQVNGDTTTITVAGGTDGLSAGQLFSSPNLNGTIVSVNASTGEIVVDAASDGAVEGFTSIPPTSFGGSLNGLFSGTVSSAGGDGANASSNVAALNGGDGGDGGNGAAGASGSGAGGAGGNGGNGSNGLGNDPEVQRDLGFAIADTVLAAANLVASSIPNIGLFPAPDPGDIVFATTDTIAAAANLAIAIDVSIDSAALFASGDSGGGGAGGAGGSGGDGEFGFGGGPGGNGGDGGNSGSPADGGAGGDGGSGGFGGFGAGGGSGGARGDGGTGGNSVPGSAGDGGVAGFGGGQGSNGLGIGGDGGSGFGGAIFVANGGNLTITGNALFDNNVVAAGSSLNFGSAGQAAGTDLFIAAGANVNLNPGEGNVQIFNGTIADDSVASFSTATNGEGAGGGITISSGLVEFNGANTFTGETNLAGGVLRADDGQGINVGSRINIAGGTLETSGVFDRTVGFNVGSVGFSGSGGFAALGDDLTVALSAGIPLTVGQGAFLPLGGSLDFGSSTSDSQVDFTNDIILNGADLGLSVVLNQNEGSNAIITGVISDGNAAGGITVNGNGALGTLFLDAENTFTGSTTVAGGRLVLTETGSLSDSSQVNIANSATFDISEAVNQTFGGLAGGGDLEIGATQLTIDQANTTTFDGVINGDGGSLVKTGSGVLTLGGTNTFTEGTEINAGTLALSATGVLTDTGTINVNSGGTLDTSASDQVIDALSGAGRVEIGSSALTTTQDFDTTFSGSIADGGIAGGSGGQLIKNGTGELTLSGANSFSGAAQVNTGTLTLSGVGSLATNTVNVASDATLNNNSSGLAAGATLTNDGSVNLNSDDTISTLVNTGTINNDQFTLEATDGFALNNGSVINANLGAGTVTANGDVALNGTSATETFTVASGSTTLGAAERLNDAVNLTIAESAQLTLGGAEQIGSLFGAGELANAANTLSVDDGDFDGEISGSGELVKTSAGNLLLTNANSFTGSAQITAGSLTLSNAGALATSTVNVDNGASLINNSAGLDASATLTANGTVQLTQSDTINGLLGSGSVELQNGSGLTLNTGDFSGNISDTGTLIKVSADELILRGQNDFSGVAQVDAGTLTLSDTGALATNTVNVASAATLTNNSSGLDAGATLTNDGTVNLNSDDTISTLVNTGTINNDQFTLEATDGFALNSGSVINANLGAGVVTANGDVALNGTSATETFNVASGTTTLGAAERLNDAVNLTIAESAQLTLGGAEQIGSLFGAGELANAGSPVSVDDGDFDGNISGSGELVKTSAGNLLLTNGNSFTGAAQITTGTLTLSNAGALATSAVNVASGATLTNNSSGLDVSATLTNDGTVNLNSDDTISTLVNTGTINNDQFTLEATDGFALNNGSVINANLGAGVVTANGSVALNGTSATETFTVASGTTTLGAAERLNDAVNLTIAESAQLTLGGAEQIGSLFGAGELANAANPLSVDDGEFDGVISGSGDLVKTSAGNLTLTGDNTFTGAAQITAGTLTLSEAGSLATNTLNVASGAALTNNSSGLAATATLTNDGTVNLNSDDTLSTLVNTGTINNDQFTLEATDGFALNNGSVINANLGAGVVTANGNVALNGSSATETFTVASGTTTLGAAERLNDVVNLTIAESAQLTLGGAEQIGSLFGAGELANAGGTLSVDDGTFAGTVSGSGGLTKTSNGTLTLSNSQTFTGTALVETGVLQILDNGTLATDTVEVASGATLLNDSAAFADATRLTANGLVQLTQGDSISALFGTGEVALANGSGLSVVQGDFSGDLSGSGALSKEGAGELILRGANTFSGAAQVNAGSLTLADNASLATDSVTVSSGATLTNASGGFAATAQLNNSGTLNINAADSVAVLNNSGTLQGEGLLTAQTYNLNDGSLVEASLGAGVVNTSGEVILSATSGAELINIAADSVLFLAESEILNDLATVNVASMGLLSLLGGDETIQRLLGEGSLATNGHNLIVTNGGEFNGSILGADESELMVTGDTLVLGGDEDTEFANVSVAAGSDIELTDSVSITANNNVQVDQGGSLSIGDGANLASDLITVDGTLTLDNVASLDYGLLNGAGSVDIASFANDSDSTVGGTLTFTGDFTNAGVLAPGNSPGLVTIGGNFTENGNLELEVISPETGGVTADQVRVGGAITLGASSVLTLINDATTPQTVGTTYNLLTDLSGAARSINGSFAQVLFDPDGVNNGQTAVSNAAAVFDLDTGQAIFTGLNSTESRFDQLGNSTNSGAVANALIAVSEEDNGDNQIRSSQLSGNFLRTALLSADVGDNLSLFAPQFLGSLADVGVQANNQSLDLARSRLLTPQAVGRFSGIVSVSTADFDGADDGTDGRLTTTTLGADYVFDNSLHLGGTIASFEGDLDARTGNVDIDSGFILQGFAGYSVTDKLDVFASLVYASQSYDIRRRSQQGSLTADTEGDSLGINLGASYDWLELRNTTLAPYAILSSNFYSQDSFTEQGAIDALAVEGYDADLYRLQSGVTLLSTYGFSNQRRLLVRGDLGVSLQLSDERDDLQASVIADNRIAFPVEVDESADAQIALDLGAVYYVAPQHSLSLDYQGKFSDTSSNTLNLRYQIEF